MLHGAAKPSSLLSLADDQEAIIARAELDEAPLDFREHAYVLFRA